MCVDYFDVKASSMTSIVTLEDVHASDAHVAARKLLKLIVLSEAVAADGAFSRQTRRKFV